MAQVIFAVDSGRRAGARLRFAAAVGLMLALSGCVPQCLDACDGVADYAGDPCVLADNPEITGPCASA